MQDKQQQQQQAGLGPEAALGALGFHDNFQGDNQPSTICLCVHDWGNAPNWARDSLPANCGRFMIYGSGVTVI